MASRFGFELVVLDSAGNNAGTIVNSQGSGITGTQVSGGKTYVSHAGPRHGSPAASWQFQWTSPSSGTGGVTFYVAGIAGDSSHTNSGDHLYTSTLVLPVSGGVQVAIPKEGINSEDKKIKAFPNPIKETVTISLDYNGKAQIKMFNIEGKLVLQKEQMVSDEHFQVDVSELGSGLYFLHVDAMGRTFKKKLIIN